MLQLAAALGPPRHKPAQPESERRRQAAALRGASPGKAGFPLPRWFEAKLSWEPVLEDFRETFQASFSVLLFPRALPWAVIALRLRRVPFSFSPGRCPGPPGRCPGLLSRCAFGAFRSPFHRALPWAAIALRLRRVPFSFSPGRCPREKGEEKGSLKGFAIILLAHKQFIGCRSEQQQSPRWQGFTDTDARGPRRQGHGEPGNGSLS